ncbi:minor tail protein [Mycobacterium phage MooMoo]|uniref:Minor tail protein n=1 Tax=Mycobacterium phage MooMoo TaxID=2108127 RepID=A0A2P1JR59_9CAUD|nr:minor tail protein [Mycobacterium phage MooMoo]AVO21625.1 minor tail protein [Mycobacterium phage MooMoo]
MIVAYNVYDADTHQKLNAQPVPIDQDFTWTGRSSGTPYRIYTTNVDQAGWESEPGEPSLVTTDAFTPESEMDPADKAVVDQIIADAMAAGAGPGLIWKITSPIGSYMGAVGSAGKRPITVDDHFRIGSATKPFTAAAVLRCVEQGLLSLEDTLADFDTPKYKLSDIPRSSEMKVRHLLMMRAGIFDEQKDINMLLRLVLFPGSEFNEEAHFNIAKAHQPMFDPGTSFHYTNASYTALGLIVQAVTGRNIRNVVIEDLFEPLGLTETSWPTTGRMPEPYASGFGGGVPGDPTGLHPSYAYAAGCIVSTINDLHKWVGHMRDSTFLGPEMYQVWMDTYCPIPLGSPFGPEMVAYGLGMYDFGDWKGHAGSWPGYECSPMWHPETGAIICVAENSQTIGTDGAGVATWSRIFPEIARHVVPGSMPNKTYISCSVPADPAVFKPAAANLGYGGVSQPVAGIGGGSTSLNAPSGSDVFAFVVWDRAATTPTVKFGGVAMDLLQVVYHNNDSASGGLAVYRAAGAGSGSAKTLEVSGASSAWVTAYGAVFGPVKSVGTPSVGYGSGTVHSQSVSNGPGTITLQAFSAAYMSSDVDVVSGARNRAKFRGTAPMLLVNTTNRSGEVSTISASPNRWASIAVNIAIAVDVDTKPLPAPLKLTGGQPAVVVDVANKVITPASAVLSIDGGRPGGEARTPTGGSIAITGGQPTINVAAAFEPFDEVNVTRTNAPVPAGAGGCYFTAGGAGGGGGSGRRSNSGYRYGGGGGGGGAYIDRVWIPRELMGPTYSSTRGLGGAGGAKSFSGDGKNGSSGGASSFTSGGISLIAGGGAGGARGTNSSSSGAGGAGGTASVTGITATSYVGGKGGNGGGNPTNGQSRSNGAGAGGGGGGGKNSNDSTFNGGSNGTSPGPGGSGGRGTGGGSGTGADGNPGEDGCNLIEWRAAP